MINDTCKHAISVAELTTTYTYTELLLYKCKFYNRQPIKQTTLFNIEMYWLQCHNIRVLLLRPHKVAIKMDVSLDIMPSIQS